MAVRTLIVDDHQLVLEGTRSSLGRFEEIEIVGLASSGNEALRVADRTRPDVVLLDIHLPDISGIEVARQLHERWPSIGIIAISGYDDAGYVRGLRSLGVNAFLRKTVSTDELVDVIRGVAAGEVTLNAEPAASAGLLEALTPREFQVFDLMRRGRRNSEIGTELGISIKAVEYHVTHILEKLDARSRAEAIIKAAQILDPAPN